MQACGRLAAGCSLRLLRHHCAVQPCATYMYYNKHEGFSRTLLNKLQQDIDLSPTGIHKWILEKKDRAYRNEEKLNEKEKTDFGTQLYAAIYVVLREGAVKFVNNDKWYEVNKETKEHGLPLKKTPGFLVEAIDLSGYELSYNSFDNLEDLPSLKYLKLSGCPSLDDWCCDRLIEYQDSLVVLDVSDCPLITERGLAALHKLPQLRRVFCHNMTGVQHPALTKLLLEQMLPHAVIDGLADYTDPRQLAACQAIPEPVPMMPPRLLLQEKEVVEDDETDSAPRVMQSMKLTQTV